MFFILWTLLAVYTLWPLYVFCMAMLKARTEGKTTVFAWTLAFPLVITAIALDISLNYTVFSVLTWDFPKKGEYTFSQRLERLVQDSGWRGKLSRWLALSLLDPYDPSGRHIK